MRMALYQILVNRKEGIRERYHRMHDGAVGIGRIVSWGWLLWLNLCYYLFFCRFLGKSAKTVMYEEKKLPLKKSESEIVCEKCDADSYAARLMQYDLISFDLFDTLIFRPFSSPGDLFFLLGEKLNFPDFKRIRMELEAVARAEKHEESGTWEVSLDEIWSVIERETGLSAAAGARLECELELELDHANPFMRDVFGRLCENGKPIVIMSDMYLPETFLERLLIKNGYHNVIRIFVSCSYRKSKWNGSLFSAAKEELQEKFGAGTRMVHVGDHKHSDVKMAEKHGFAALHYPNADSSGMIYRAQDMSALIGGAYRGIVDHHLHTGWKRYSMEYEYGYVYGGIFALGYCAFIHEYVKKNQIDRLLFFSRDGDILKKAYDLLYPGEQTDYVYWSRAAALKLTADENRYDFFRRFLYHKVNKKKSIRQILREMELEPLLAGDKEGTKGENAPDDEGSPKRNAGSGGEEGWGDKEDAADNVDGREILTDQNVGELKRFLLRHWDAVLAVYQEQREAAKRYYAQILDGCSRAAAVDIGWAGSGYMALRTLVEDVWKLPCRLTGILAGTNTTQNAEPDAAGPQIQSGRLVSYLFSQAHNRDLLKKHDPDGGDNVYWELLTASPTRQFLGFALSEDNGRRGGGRQELGITLRFGNAPVNPAGCVQIQNGVMDFVKEYRQRFSAYPYMYAVSGRDAYAPMLAAGGNHGRYLRQIAERFGMEIDVSCEGEIVCRSM